MTYKLYCTQIGGTVSNAAITTTEDGKTISFVFDPDNTDFVQYQKWLSEGNQPLPADEPNA